MEFHALDEVSSPQHVYRSSVTRPRVAVLWRGSPARQTPAPHAARLAPVLDALERAGLAPEGLAWFDDESEALEARLGRFRGVLVWINPLADGRDRQVVDAALRRLADAGVWVSTHPDVTLRMGTKEVLYTTRELGWGSDTDLYADGAAFLARFWARLDAGAVRVLKPLRGNDGQGVMKVAAERDVVRVQHASDDRAELLARSELRCRVDELLARGSVIDQPFHANVAAGMVRCYLSRGVVVGFAEQWPRHAGAGAFGMNSAKTMHCADAPAFADLRDAMENEWVPAMQRTLALPTDRLPALWDADFLYRAPDDARTRGRFVLCEVNVSCVSPFPDAAPNAIAAVAAAQCLAR